MRTILGASSAATADLHLARQEKHWTSGYWRRHHQLLLDVVEQFGHPDLFLTIAPYEWSFLWPYWVERVHRVLGEGPTSAAGAEVLSVAHALHQLCAGLLCGRTNHFGRPFILADKTGQRAETVKCFFARYEFQDGGSTNEFGKGRGSFYVHMLIWLRKIRNILLERSVLAHLPENNCLLSSLASVVQTSKTSIQHAAQEEVRRTYDEGHHRWQLHPRCS